MTNNANVPISSQNWVLGQNMNMIEDDILCKMYNYMKIAQMPQYGMTTFQKQFHALRSQITETHILTMITSYWCDRSHLEFFINHRGLQIKGGTLRLVISLQLLNRTVDCGPSFNKMELMLQTRRKDLKECPDAIHQGEREFFKRNCCSRIGNFEVPVRIFQRNGWLTPQLAQIAWNKFVPFMRKRMKTYRILSTCKKKHFKWSELAEVLSTHGADMGDDDSNLPPEIIQSFLRGENTRVFQLLPQIERKALACVNLPAAIWNTIVSMLVCTPIELSLKPSEPNVMNATFI